MLIHLLLPFRYMIIPNAYLFTCEIFIYDKLQTLIHLFCETFIYDKLKCLSSYSDDFSYQLDCKFLCIYLFVKLLYMISSDAYPFASTILIYDKPKHLSIYLWNFIYDKLQTLIHLFCETFIYDKLKYLSNYL